MAASPIGDTLHKIQGLYARGTGVGQHDAILLERFVRERDEDAFSILVARHGPMVLAVCRSILKDPSDVEDAFQATFLVLVIKARGLWLKGSLGPWLHKVAHRV